MATGVRQGGLALIAALTQITGMVLAKIGAHLIGQGKAEIIMGTAPPPFGPNPALIAHGGAMVKTGTGLVIGGAIAGVAGSAMSTIASERGRGGPPGSIMNPVYTQPAAVGPPTYVIDTQAALASTGPAGGGADNLLAAEISRLSAVVSRLSVEKEGVLVKKAFSRHGAQLLGSGTIEEIARESGDETYL